MTLTSLQGQEISTFIKNYTDHLSIFCFEFVKTICDHPLIPPRTMHHNYVSTIIVVVLIQFVFFSVYLIQYR